VNFTGPVRAAAWRALSLGCRYRKPVDESLGAVGTAGECHHVQHAGPCTAEDAALGRCPILELAIAGSAVQGLTGGIGRVIDGMRGAWDRVSAKIGRRPRPGRVPDYYALLGLPRDTPVDVIKSRIRELQKQWDPDAGTAPNERKMKDLNEARDVLTDPATRADYDRVLRGS